MSTDEKFKHSPDVISRVTLRPGESTISSVGSSTAILDVSTSSTTVTTGSTLVSAVVVHIDGNDAIRQANEALSGVARVEIGSTQPNK